MKTVSGGRYMTELLSRHPMMKALSEMVVTGLADPEYSTEELVKHGDKHLRQS